MKSTQTLFLGLLVLLEFFVITIFALPDDELSLKMGEPSVAFTYERMSEVEKHCSSLLSSASEWKPDYDEWSRIIAELAFKNGDWEQKTGGEPFMPFSDKGMPSSNASLPTALKLVSFEVREVSPVRHFQHTISVGGHLVIGISKEISFAYGYNPAPNFIRPGSSALTLAFEGIYTETEENGGERHLCLLGKSTVPSDIKIDVHSDFKNGFGLEADQILLVLRYPMTFNLTNREVHGEMHSLKEQGSPNYFDTVYISSQLSHKSMYQFSSKVLASTTCERYLYYRDEVMEDGVQKFTWSEFCTMFDYVSWQAFSVLPDYKFSGSHSEDNILTSVLFGKEIGDVNLSHKHSKLILQHLKCIQETSNDSNGAKVSAVLRVISAEMNPHVARTMTGLSGLVFNAEGRWNPSSGQLCMLGCPTGEDSEFKRCTLWISLYFPRALSIKQRSLVFGSISNIRDEVSSKHHLLFDSVLMQPSNLNDPYYWYNTSYLSYNYSKLSLASSFKSRTQRFTALNHSLLRYPALKEGEEPLARLDFLSTELLVDGYVAPDQRRDGSNTSISIRMEVLSLGPLLGRFNKDGPEELRARTTANVNLNNSQLLNVSTHLIFRELKEVTQEFNMISYLNISQMFLEGIYDPVIGEMHLIGCRKAFTGGSGIERRLDCLIEVEIQYPSENMDCFREWFMNPATRITITSQRDQDDPLYFSSVSLKIQITHRPVYASTVAHRRTFEGIIRILLLGGVIAITLTQIHYMKEQTHIVPYVSLVMLALQILGYSFPLVSGAQVLFKFKESRICLGSPYDPGRYLLPKVLDYAGRVLLLVSLLLTSWIFQMVYKSRNKPLGPSPSKMTHHCVPHNKLVLFTTLAVYTFGILTWSSFNGNHEMLLHPENGSYKTRASHVQEIWTSIVENFAGVLQDFFLLPQILSNFLWHTNVKSLGKAYYLGLTLVRLILHLYSYIRDPILESKFEDFESESLDNTYAEFCKLAAVIITVVLAAVVHIQQNWKKLTSQSLELRNQVVQ